VFATLANMLSMDFFHSTKIAADRNDNI